MDFVIICSLVLSRLPYIRFLFVGSRICSTLLSDLASRLNPCTSLHFTVVRLCEDLHLQLSNMLGTQKTAGLTPGCLVNTANGGGDQPQQAAFSSQHCAPGVQQLEALWAAFEDAVEVLLVTAVSQHDS